MKKTIQKHQLIIFSTLIFLCFFILPVTGKAKDKKPLELSDIMKFKKIKGFSSSDNGNMLIYTLHPNRGDSQVIIKDLLNKKTFSIPRGVRPKLTPNGNWAGVLIQPEVEKLLNDNKKKLKNDFLLFDIKNKDKKEFKKVSSFSFSKNSHWLVMLTDKDLKKDKESKDKTTKKKKKDTSGKYVLTLKNLISGKEISMVNINKALLSEDSNYLMMIQKDQGINHLKIIDLKTTRALSLLKGKDLAFSSFSWSKKGCQLAFLVKTEKKHQKKTESSSLYLWNGNKKKLSQHTLSTGISKDWIIPFKSNLRWTKDGQRLFFGLKPVNESIFYLGKEIDPNKKKSIFDIKTILEDREVDVWHYNDPLINSNQKLVWDRLKKKTYPAILTVKDNRIVQLTDYKTHDANFVENKVYTLGSSSKQYQKEITWDGRYADQFLINLRTGKKEKLLSHFSGPIYLSNHGKYVLYYLDRNWHLYNIKKKTHQNLTNEIKTPFFNEDHDYPSAVPSYRIAGWLKDDKGVLIYDKYDIWYFNPQNYQYKKITNGRTTQITYRIVKTDEDQNFYNWTEKLLITGYHNQNKNKGFFNLILKTGDLKKLLFDKKWVNFISKTKKGNRYFYTQESIEEYPDFWITDSKFKNPKKLTQANPQIKDFIWSKSELVQWKSADGTDLQGILIKPTNYIKGKKYPVLVYYYRFFTQRMYQFNEIVINHRPCFPFYTSHDYLVFLPDIVFKPGTPGFSATKCLVPGIHKLINMGVADPEAIGLHGHSWSGYQTAHVITQTNIFTAAVAGAPVSNMTSAYSGIRWGSGLARQFQYEKSQSRIGGTLWNSLPKYIENSPVFYADRIETPLLIQFGDIDGAVPWYQGIELYLAMRRLNKDCIFLQYNKEPHHLKKYANKLDYTIKMKEYFDHYLKGTKAPDWIKKGVPYQKTVKKKPEKKKTEK